MTSISQPESTPWRLLTEAELAASPEAKLGGALAVIFACAVVLVTALVLVVAVLIAFGNFFAIVMMSQALTGSGMTSVVSRISLVPQAMLFVWAFVFVAMTLARRPSTPKVASVMIAAWAALSIGAQIAIRYVIAMSNVDLASQATLLPYILFEIALVAAFWGYMDEGRRPNVFFRRRVRA